MSIFSANVGVDTLVIINFYGTMIVDFCFAEKYTK